MDNKEKLLSCPSVDRLCAKFLIDTEEREPGLFASIDRSLLDVLITRSWQEGFWSAVTWIYGAAFGQESAKKKEVLSERLVAAVERRKTIPREIILHALAEACPTHLLEDVVVKLENDKLWKGVSVGR